VQHGAAEIEHRAQRRRVALGHFVAAGGDKVCFVEVEVVGALRQLVALRLQQIADHIDGQHAAVLRDQRRYRCGGEQPVYRGKRATRGLIRIHHAGGDSGPGKATLRSANMMETGARDDSKGKAILAQSRSCVLFSIS
jgi:hypothetical protein